MITGVEKYKKIPVQVRASLWFLVCSFLQKGISVITTPIFTRLLSTSEYGYVSVWTSWSGIVGIIVTLQLSAGVYTQGLIKYSNKDKIFSGALQGLNFSLCLIWTGGYFLFRNFWNNFFGFTTIQMLAMLLSLWASAAFTFWTTAQRVQYKYRAMVIITIIASVFTPLLQLLLIFNNDDKATSKILGGVIISLIMYSWTFIYQIFKGRTFFSKNIWLYALGYNIPLIPHYLSGVVLNNSDRIMIESMVDYNAAGIYSLAYSLAQLMLLFNDAICKTMNPWIYSQIRDKKTQDLKCVVYPTMIFVAIVNVMLIALAPEVVRLFAPPAYYEAIYVIPPVAMSVFFQFVYNVFCPFEFYYEKQQYIAISSVVAAIANIGLNVVFIRVFGYIAAGYTTLVCYGIYAFMHYFFMRRVCIENGIDNENIYNLKTIILVSVLFMTVGFLFLIVYKFTLARYIFVLLLLVVFYLKRDIFKKYFLSFRSLVK